MNEHAARMRNVAAQACRKDGGVRLHEFMSKGLEDVLLAAEEKGYGLIEIAVEVLAACCLEDGKYNNFLVGVIAVSSFLRASRCKLTEQALRDLLAVLNNPGTAKGLYDWADLNIK